MMRRVNKMGVSLNIHAATEVGARVASAHEIAGIMFFPFLFNSQQAMNRFGTLATFDA